MRPPCLLVAGALLAAALAPLALGAPAARFGPGPGDPLVVVGHVDVGINPYHDAFRWDDPRAQQHPCTYIPAYPCDAVALRLHLDEPDYDTALALDKAVWEAVEQRLYWIPGTKIIGAYTFGYPGDYAILDDAGHGTMTASRSAGNMNSLCPECLFVSIEGLGVRGVRWLQESGFVDVQTNSWGGFPSFPAAPGVPGVLPSLQGALAEAAAAMPVVFASGNGINYQGVVSEPTLLGATGAPGVILVGAHDNGRVLTWPGGPPHVIADGYGPWTALYQSTSAMAADLVACCTSTSAPYAAGGVAALVAEARRVLGGSPGIRGGVVAEGPAGLVPQGPLADGVFTLGELQRVLFHAATPRPVEQPDDGLLHWSGGPDPGAVQPTPQFLLRPGQNPYCIFCMSTPLEFRHVPGDVGLWDREGYGAVDAPAVALAKAVLRGEVAEPARPVEDALYAADQAAREAGLVVLG